MRKILAVLFAMAVMFLSASPALASRPIAGHKFKDQCHNIKGTQTAYSMPGHYVFITATKRPHDCKKVSLSKH